MVKGKWDWHISDNISMQETKTIEEIIEEDNADEIDPLDATCFLCKEPIDGKYSFYQVEDIGNSSLKNHWICSVECLRSFKDRYPDEAYHCHVYEYWLCSAYYKCLEIGNLRRKCISKENRSIKDLRGLSLINFCEPGQAGIVLATYKIHETLEQFSRESDKQFKITVWLTLLVIVLTFINLLPIIMNLISSTN